MKAFMTALRETFCFFTLRTAIDKDEFEKTWFSISRKSGHYRRRQTKNLEGQVFLR